MQKKTKLSHKCTHKYKVILNKAKKLKKDNKKVLIIKSEKMLNEFTFKYGYSSNHGKKIKLN